jgi:uncharacterized protein
MTPTRSTVHSSAQHSWLRRFAVRRPLTAFLVLGMSLGYTLAFVWGLAYYGVIPGGGLADALQIAPDELVGAATLLALFPAALFVTWATSGRAGVRILLRRAFHWRVSLGWWLLVLFGLPILTVGLALLLGDHLHPVDISSLVVSQLTLLFVNFIVTNLWEETAWTGVFQTRLEERHTWLVAAILTAIPFAAMHLPLQFFLGQPVTIGRWPRPSASTWCSACWSDLCWRCSVAGPVTAFSSLRCCTACSTGPTTKTASPPRC